LAEKWTSPRLALLLACLVLAPAPARGDDDLELLEHQALAAAAARVAPSVLRIETVGGLERVDQVLFGTGPTTGLVIDAQGYIVSSAFNFVNKPASILVRLPDGARKPARLIATDHNRMFVLLKVQSDRPLPVPEFAPPSETRVGQWCVVLGRTFEGDRPNLSVGILSAKGRVWGKALQYDAAASPSNYGGPLVDLRGRVLGLVVPLSPQSNEEIAGVEWYDSGIGFAIPIDELRQILPEMKKGKDLYPGLAGFHPKSPSLYTGDSLLSACHPRSPAAKAGFKSGDRIVEINGRKITRAGDIKTEIGQHYAGQKITVTALRGKEQFKAELELVPKLEPYEHPFLGILPLRSPDERSGVAVRYVYPGSPAAAAHVEPGDTLVAWAGKPIDNRNRLREAIAQLEPGQQVPLAVGHAGQTHTAAVKLDHLPDALPPASLPPARVSLAASGGQRPARGVMPLRVAEFKNEILGYVPAAYDPAVPHGIVVYLQPSGAAEQKDLLTHWKPLCDRHDLIFVAPKPAHNGDWTSDDVTLVEKLVRQLQSGYAIDAARVVVMGRETGGALAYQAAFRQRDLFRAVVAVNAMLTVPPPDNDPQYRLAIYSITAQDSPQNKLQELLLSRFRQMKMPVTQKPLTGAPRDLRPDELSELARWIDMLDRI
jgi:serine protease Do